MKLKEIPLYWIDCFEDPLDHRYLTRGPQKGSCESQRLQIESCMFGLSIISLTNQFRTKQVRWEKKVENHCVRWCENEECTWLIKQFPKVIDRDTFFISCKLKSILFLTRSQSYQTFLFVKWRFFLFFALKLGHFNTQTIFYLVTNTQP